MGTMMNDLLTLSRKYGSDPDWVVAGGGNTSLKDGEVLYVKASGYPLSTIGEEGFARMDRSRLAAIWNTEYPGGSDDAAVADRERLVLADMMAARMPGEERRPSVETLLHDLLPWPLIVHLHPTMVNGLTCGVDGKEMAEEIFGEDMCWIPVTDPGYVLATVIRKSLDERSGRGLDSPDFIFLANHGVFVGGADAAEVDGKYDRLRSALEGRLKRRPGTMPKEAVLPGDAEDFRAVARGLFGEKARLGFVGGGELVRYMDSGEDAAALTGCITPDHIVYAGPGALYLSREDIASTGGNIAEAWKIAADAYTADRGKPPNLTLVNDGSGVSGALICAAGEKAFANAAILLDNALEVCAYAESFGGPLMLEDRFIRFIVNWEVENYRSQLASE